MKKLPEPGPDPGVQGRGPALDTEERSQSARRELHGSAEGRVQGVRKDMGKSGRHLVSRAAETSSKF